MGSLLSLAAGLEIQMSKFKHSTGKHIPVLFLSNNNSNKAVCPVHSLWSYLQLTGKVSSKVQPLYTHWLVKEKLEH
jgi:hypothetical protein